MADIPEQCLLFRDECRFGPKKPFFSITISKRLLSIDPCALFSEAAVRNSV